MKTFKSFFGQSLFDICLQCYGSLDFVYKLIQDNGIDNINVIPAPNTSFVYDSTLTVNLPLQQKSLLNNIIYSTI